MKRLHVHVAVESLQHAIDFYTALFAAPPTVLSTTESQSHIWRLLRIT
jgi:hypothetical protein